jgi:hypothetical protein
LHVAEPTRISERPTIEEVTERIRLREPVETGTTAPEIIRAEREAR